MGIRKIEIRNSKIECRFYDQICVNHNNQRHQRSIKLILTQDFIDKIINNIEIRNKQLVNQ